MVKRPLEDSISLRECGHNFLLNKEIVESLHIIGVLGLSNDLGCTKTLDESTPFTDENLK